MKRYIKTKYLLPVVLGWTCLVPIGIGCQYGQTAKLQRDCCMVWGPTSGPTPWICSTSQEIQQMQMQTQIQKNAYRDPKISEQILDKR